MKNKSFFITTCLFVMFFVLLIQAKIAFSDDLDERFKKSEAFKYNQKGVAYLNNKNFLLSVEEFKKSLELFPDYYATYSNLGYAYLYSGKPNEALECFKKVIILKPEFPEGIRGIGSTYLALKQEDEALKYLEKSIKMDPNIVPPYMALGNIYNNQKRFAEAIAMFEKVIEKEPTFVPAYTNISLAYTMQNEFEKGYEYMKKAQKLSPNDPTINDLMLRFDDKLKSQKATLEAIQKDSMIQEPKGDTMELVDFVPVKIGLPFNIKYPAKWYVRETVENAPSLYITREPIRNVEDKYKVGVAAIYSADYFISREAADTKFGKMAKAVLKAKNWVEDKKGFVQNLKQNGFTILSQSDIKISDQPALRVEYKSILAQVTILYVKLGKDLLMIFFEAPPGEYGAYRDTFERMINSFAIRNDFKIIDEGTIFEKVVQEQIAERNIGK